MNHKNYIITISSILIVMLFSIIFSISNANAVIKPANNIVKLGSVSQGSEYQATSTDTAWTVAKNGVTGGIVLQSYPGVLGSVIITSATAGNLNLYDATNTNSNLATTTKLRMGVSVAAGTYTCDCILKYGLVAEFTTAIGPASSTITYR